MAFKWIRGVFSNDLSIDLGTASTLIYAYDKGIVLSEPSVVAVREDGNARTVVAVGLEAKKMLGRTPENIETIRPLREGVIADFNITEKMLKYFIQKIHKEELIKPSPRVLICVPCKATQVERRAIRESAYGAGAREVFLIEEPLAAAIGAGLPIEDPTGSMVMDIGGGTTEIAVLSLGGAVYSNSIRIGGDKFHEHIISYVKKQYGCLIGEVTAEKVKHEIATAVPNPKEILEVEVRGRMLAEGVPRNISINSQEIFEAISEPLAAIVEEVKITLENVPPELASDIGENGMVLTGGGALLRNLDKLISEEVGIPVLVVDDPLTCVVRGGGMALNLINKKEKFELLFATD